MSFFIITLWSQPAFSYCKDNYIVLSFETKSVLSYFQSASFFTSCLVSMGFFLLYSSASVFVFCSLHVDIYGCCILIITVESFSSVLLLQSSLIIFKIFMIKKFKQILTLIRTFMRCGLWRKLIFVQYNNDFNIALFRTSTKLFQQQKMINGSL